MVDKIELIVFSECPLADRARAAIRSAGIFSFVEILQDKLGPEDPYRSFASPTILLNGTVLYGSATTGSACSLVNWSELAARLTAFQKEAEGEASPSAPGSARKSPL
jgi:hypothetical protein